MVGKRRAVVGVLVSAVLAISVWAAAPSNAFIFVAPDTSWPSSGVVGQTIEASIGLGNFSTPPDSTNNPVLTATAIDLYPACSSGDVRLRRRHRRARRLRAHGPLRRPIEPARQLLLSGQLDGNRGRSRPLAPRPSGR